MVLDLRALLSSSGGTVPFDYEPDLSELISESVSELAAGSRVSGTVRYGAGLLTLTADARAEARCVCARCLKEFDMPLHRHISVVLVREEDGGREDADRYVVSGDRVDIDEIVVTEFILNSDFKLLCSEDCKGLCGVCGKNLNEGSCGCVRAPDPRLAVLGRLLETTVIEDV
jgi:uncharacterized protein